MNWPSARKAGMERVVQPHSGDCLCCEKASLGLESKGVAQKKDRRQKNSRRRSDRVSAEGGGPIGHAKYGKTEPGLPGHELILPKIGRRERVLYGMQPCPRLRADSCFPGDLSEGNIQKRGSRSGATARCPVPAFPLWTSPEKWGPPAVKFSYFGPASRRT
jgi:hypothetical protein